MQRLPSCARRWNGSYVGGQEALIGDVKSPLHSKSLFWGSMSVVALHSPNGPEGLARQIHLVVMFALSSTQ